MALTQGAWTQQVVGTGKYQVWKCNVAFTTAENDAYTLKTPDTLDTTKAWALAVVPAATADGQALPVDMWCGYKSDFALSGDSTTVAATSGFEFKTIIDDASAATARLVLMDPNATQADVVAVATGGLRVKPPIFPYYAFNLDGGSTLNATNVDFYIIQHA
jgi:hypothetical protein